MLRCQIHFGRRETNTIPNEFIRHTLLARVNVIHLQPVTSTGPSGYKTHVSARWRETDPVGVEREKHSASQTGRDANMDLTETKECVQAVQWV